MSGKWAHVRDPLAVVCHDQAWSPEVTVKKASISPADGTGGLVRLPRTRSSVLFPLSFGPMNAWSGVRFTATSLMQPTFTTRKRST